MCKKQKHTVKMVKEMCAYDLAFPEKIGKANNQKTREFY
jgi:hypothetical protein